MLNWHFIHFENKKAWETALYLGREIWGAKTEREFCSKVNKQIFFKNVFACVFINWSSLHSLAKKKKNLKSNILSVYAFLFLIALCLTYALFYFHFDGDHAI